MKKFMLTAFFLVSLIMFGQEKAGLRGRILDEANQPLPGATILLSDIKSGTSADFNGYFELLNIPSGKYKVTISFIGYKTIEKEIKLTSGIQSVTYNMDIASDKLDEIIIQGSVSRGQAKALNLQRSKSNITNIISADQVGKFPDANMGDALKRVPGIAMQNDHCLLYTSPSPRDA